MPSHALDQRLFEQMFTTIGEGDASTAAPTDGIKLINGWLEVVQGTQRTAAIENQLIELRGQLQFANPDPDRIRDLLASLADNVTQITQGSNVQEQTIGKLEKLATALRNFGDRL
ncbi:hypothetical protein ACFSUS_10560 [Spirosoma soli]|uniref:Uncharacterized protein n=1 Tax=Spirosoma soli TaxID=1770529 RepID=A0ABW5M203_9BACT